MSTLKSHCVGISVITTSGLAVVISLVQDQWVPLIQYENCFVGNNQSIKVDEFC